MRGHVPLVMATIADGIRRGEFDHGISAPLIVIAAAGLGALPQLARRAARALPLFALLPPPEKLAALSIDLLFRAPGAGERREAGGDDRRHPRKNAKPTRSPRDAPTPVVSLSPPFAFRRYFSARPPDRQAHTFAGARTLYFTRLRAPIWVLPPLSKTSKDTAQ